MKISSEIKHLYNCDDRVLPLSLVSPIEAASLISKRPQQLIITHMQKPAAVTRRSLMAMVGPVVGPVVGQGGGRVCGG